MLVVAPKLRPCSLKRRASIISLSDEEKRQTLQLLITSGDNLDQSTIFDVVRLGNIELFTLLMKRIEQQEPPGDSCGPHIQQLQDSYTELKLKNVPLSSEMQLAVEQKLLDYHFFCKRTSVTSQEIVPTLEDVRQRIKVTLELIEFLCAQYCTGDLDQQFTFVGRSVAQHLHILRRQMKGTYDVLPWDEMLFCLVTFISCIDLTKESECFYCLVLDRKNILNHLTSFGESLANVDLDKKEWKRKRLATSRGKNIDNVVKSKPAFEALYKDFEIIRNIYSLKRILKYVKLALTVDVQKDGAAGVPVIQRALQVSFSEETILLVCSPAEPIAVPVVALCNGRLLIWPTDTARDHQVYYYITLVDEGVQNVIGECLKNTPDSPHVSADVHSVLGCDAPRAARETLTALRNLLSHGHTLDKKLRLEDDPGCFYSLQRDLRKIEVEISVILKNKLLETVVQFLNKIVKINNLDELKKLYRSMRHMNFTVIDDVVKSTAEIELIQDMLRQLEDCMRDKTLEQTLFMDEIKEIVGLREGRKLCSTDYIQNFSELFNTINYYHNILTFRMYCQKFLNKMLAIQTDSVKLKNIIPLLKSISANPSTEKEIIYLCYKIFCMVSFEETRIKGIETLNESLLQTETVSQDDITKMTQDIFSKVHRRLVSHDSKIAFKKVLQSQKQIYENKLKLLNLCQSSVSDLESFVSLLKEMNFKPKNVKELVNRYKDDQFKECTSRLNIVIVEYESFVRTLSKGHLLSYKYYNEALDTFFGALKLENKLRSEVMDIVEGLKNERKQEISDYYDKRLTLLKDLLDHSKCDTLRLVHGEDQVKAAAEMLLLDLTEMLDCNDLFVDGRLLYDEFSSVLIGKNLRNYLAHGDALVDVFPFDPAIAIACSAAKLIFEGKDLIVRKDILIGRRTIFNLTKLKETQEKYQRIVTKQNDLFVAARNDDLEHLQTAIDEGADVRGRDLNGWTGLHYAAEKDSVKTFANLLAQNLNVATKDMYDRTPIHVAFTHGSLLIIQLLEDMKLFDVKHDKIIDLLSLVTENGHHVLIDKMIQNQSVTENDLCKPFGIAIHTGHIKIVEVMLKSGLNLTVTKMSIPPLHLAAFFDRKEVVTLLLENSAEVDALDELNRTPLYWAAIGGSKDSALGLLDWGANVNASADDGTTPLLIALQERHEDCALAFLEKNADIDLRDEYSHTALHYAADGLEKAVNVLLDRKSNIDELTVSKHTPLYIASKGGYDRIVMALIKKGANIHNQASKSLTALHVAALNGHRYVVEILLQNGARVGDRTDFGWTALHMAAKSGRKDVVETLLNYGAEIDAEGKQHQNPLHLAALNGHTEVVRMLMKSGARTSATTMDNLTALHLAVQHDHENVVVLLLQQGADVCAAGDDRWTALHMAANLGYSTIARRLIENNAPVDVLTNSHLSPLFLAVKGGHKNVVELLLEMDADITGPGGDAGMMTPLIQAAEDGHKDIVNALLEKQRCVKDHLEENARALDLAAGRGYKDIVILLISKGRLNIKHHDGLAPLLSAAVNGFVDIVSILLDNNAEVNVRGVGGCSALHAATENGHINVVRILIDRHAEVNATSDKQWTALHVAALNGHEKVVQALVEHNADVEAKTIEDYAALHLAAFKGFRSIVELLIQSGANVNSSICGNRTALHAAAKHGHTDVVRVLLDNGANIFAFSKNNFTALHFAASDGHLEIVGIIIDYLVKNEGEFGLVNFINIPLDSGATPLHLAAGNGHKEIVVLLLQKGARLNAVTKKNESVLHLAAQNNHIDVVRILLKEGIDVACKNSNNSRALDYAALKGNAGVVEELVRHGADIFFKGIKNTSVLHTAVISGKVCCVNVLINLAKEQGEDSLEDFVNSPDEDNWTALHLAAQNGHGDIVSFLLQNAAYVDAEDTDEWTALHVAARNGHEDVIEKLLAAGADVQAQIGDGATALHLAAMSGFINIVECLVNFVKVNRPDQLGAFINLGDVNDCTALQLARQCGRTDIVQLLLQALCINIFQDM